MKGKKYSRYFLFFIIVILVVLLDFLSKYFLKEKFLMIIPKILLIKYSENPGVIFGIFSNNFIVTVILPILLILILIYFFIKENLKVVPIALIVSGLIGNLIDRFIYGFVIDFIYIPVIPQYNIFLFNLADLSLIIGVILMLYYLKK